MVIESIKEGFHITHKNWQVILLQIIVIIINFAGFFLFVGVPIAIAIASAGVDIAQVKDILPGILENPVEFLSKYLKLVILIYIAFILYLTVASVLTLYVFGGMLGVLRNAALNEQYKFSFSSFFEEAKKIFFPLLWLFSIALLAIIGVLVVFGILAGILISIIRVYSETVAVLSEFATYFFGLLGIIIGLFSVIFAAYAAIALVVEEGKVISSFKSALNFITNKPMAFLFYIILVIGIMTVNLVLITLGASSHVTPLIGILLSVPYQLMFYVVQSYLGVVMWSSLLIFYIKGINYPIKGKTPGEPSAESYMATYDI